MALPKTLMCEPELLAKDLSGRVYIVTGANSGAGLATAEQLVKQGAHVVGACRRVDAGEDAFAGFGSPSGTAEVMKLDLGSLASVRTFAETFTAKHDRLDGLANNAGLMGVPEGTTEDGFETQLGVNYLGHFLLTELLLDTLKARAPSRVVNVSSVAHVGTRRQVAEIHLDDLTWESREYNGIMAYSESKLAMVLHASHLAKRLEGTGVSVFSNHPGWVRSNLAAGMMPGWANRIWNIILRPLSRPLGTLSAFEGAQSTLHCLLDDDAPNHNGAYFSQNSVLYPNRENRPGGWPMSSPNPHAHDEELAEQLYDRSLQLVGLTSDA